METSSQSYRTDRQAAENMYNKANSQVGGHTDNKIDSEADGQEVRVRQASCRHMGRQPRTYFTFSILYFVWHKKLSPKIFNIFT